jgi:hypothetical protein
LRLREHCEGSQPLKKAAQIPTERRWCSAIRAADGIALTTKRRFIESHSRNFARQFAKRFGVRKGRNDNASRTTSHSKSKVGRPLFAAAM